MPLPALNPNVKLAYAADKWDSEVMQDSIVCLEAVVCLALRRIVTQLIYMPQFDEYYTPPPAVSPEATTSAIGKLFATCSHMIVINLLVDLPSSHNVQYGHSWMCTTVQARKAQDCLTSNPRKELDQYLAAPLEDVDNVVRWWGVSAVSYITLMV
jgi:hypothetical protein